MLTKLEIVQLGEMEMENELSRSRKDLLKTKFAIMNGHSKEIHTVKNLKRYIARLLTIMKERKMAKPVTASTAAPDQAETTTASLKAETPVKTMPVKAKTAMKPAKKRTVNKK